MVKGSGRLKSKRSPGGTEARLIALLPFQGESSAGRKKVTRLRQLGFRSEKPDEEAQKREALASLVGHSLLNQRRTRTNSTNGITFQT